LHGKILLDVQAPLLSFKILTAYFIGSHAIPTMKEDEKERTMKLLKKKKEEKE
jgi:hypothetical protein